MAGAQYAAIAIGDALSTGGGIGNRQTIGEDSRSPTHVRRNTSVLCAGAIQKDEGAGAFRHGAERKRTLAVRDALVEQDLRTRAVEILWAGSGGVGDGVGEGNSV